MPTNPSVTTLYIRSGLRLGMTSRSFKTRMGEHRDYEKRDVLTEPSGEHFNTRGHTVADIKGQVIEKVRSKEPFVLRAREAILIRTFDKVSTRNLKKAAYLTFSIYISKFHVCKKHLQPTLENLELPSHRIKEMNIYISIERHCTNTMFCF